ncbi:MAG: hypothetical protein J3K34DRAFT_81816 [Monoraphidium minutum]|nr:MAG: hypothetical protein J3K34DRAFT_81816 [Monoraphidium minutum]
MSCVHVWGGELREGSCACRLCKFSAKGAVARPRSESGARGTGNAKRVGPARGLERGTRGKNTQGTLDWRGPLGWLPLGHNDTRRDRLLHTDFVQGSRLLPVSRQGRRVRRSGARVLARHSDAGRGRAVPSEHGVWVRARWALQEEPPAGRGRGEGGGGWVISHTAQMLRGMREGLLPRVGRQWAGRGGGVAPRGAGSAAAAAWKAIVQRAAPRAGAGTAPEGYQSAGDGGEGRSLRHHGWGMAARGPAGQGGFGRGGGNRSAQRPYWSAPAIPRAKDQHINAFQRTTAGGDASREQGSRAHVLRRGAAPPAGRRAPRRPARVRRPPARRAPCAWAGGAWHKGGGGRAPCLRWMGLQAREACGRAHTAPLPAQAGPGASQVAEAGAGSARGGATGAAMRPRPFDRRAAGSVAVMYTIDPRVCLGP